MLIKTGVQWGVHYPGVGFESKENKITIMKTKRMEAVLVGEPPRRPPDAHSASDVFVDKQRLRGGCAAAHRVDPHGTVHRGGLLMGAAVRQVGINLRKTSPQLIHQSP